MVDQYSEKDQPKKVADRYLKQEVLGQGTYGVVFKATDTKVTPHSIFFKRSHETRVHILLNVLNLGWQETDFVFLGPNLQNGKTVAIKKIRLGKEKEGVNITALREIKLLKELKHPHIIELVDAFPHK